MPVYQEKYHYLSSFTSINIWAASEGVPAGYSNTVTISKLGTTLQERCKGVY